MFHQSDILGSIDLAFLQDNRTNIDNNGDIHIGKEIQFIPRCDEQIMMVQQDRGGGIRDSDVICGKGKLVHSHPGNKQFRKLINFRRESYQTANIREEKKQITNSVIDTIHRLGGRFLKMDENHGEYIEVSDEYRYEKVSHALRSAKKTSSHPRTVSYDASVPVPPELKIMESAMSFNFHDLKRQQLCLLRTISGENKSNDQFESFAKRSVIQHASENDTALLEPPINVSSSSSVEPVALVDKDLLALLEPTLEPRHSLDYGVLEQEQDCCFSRIVSSNDDVDNAVDASDAFEDIDLDPINNLNDDEAVVGVDKDVLNFLLQL